MTFVKKSADKTPIVDNVFSIVSKAKQDKQQNGSENVIDATIGSLYGEDEKLVALDEVFNHYDAIDHRTKAAYASSFSGNPDYRKAVYEWVKQDADVKLAHSVIATPGGSGAVSMSIETFLDAGDTLMIPDIAWGNYALMASVNNINVERYHMFEEDHFNLNSVKETIQKVMLKQDHICMVINDPCHNPTGYSLTKEEWKELITFLNEVSKTHSVVLLNDIAYIDFAYGQEKAKEYFKEFDKISENVAVVVSFSLSKSMTSYGMRCGAAILMAKDEKALEDMKNVFEKSARATWSNINNGAMAMFVDVLENHRDAYNEERRKYVALLKERSSIFVEEAKAVGLKHYPYKEGFFVTLSMDNETRDKFHAALMGNHIYTVKVNQGIRVAVCSLSVEKCKELAGKMKKILDTIA